MIQTNMCYQWKLKKWWKQLTTSREPIIFIQNGYKEANSLMNYLANAAMAYKMRKVIFSIKEPLWLMRGILCTRKGGFLYIKKKKHLQAYMQWQWRERTSWGQEKDIPLSTCMHPQLVRVANRSIVLTYKKKLKFLFCRTFTSLPYAYYK